VVRSIRMGPRYFIRKCSGILRNLTPFLPPSSFASIDLDKDIILPVLVPVVSSVSLRGATETVRDLVLDQQARHDESTPSFQLTYGDGE